MSATGTRRTFEVTTQDAMRLEVEHIPAARDPWAAVWVGHAALANRRSVDRPLGEGFASHLAARGLEVYTFDVRGHGRSAALSPEATATWCYDDVVRRDIPAVHGFVRSRHPALPVAGVGHSLTGHGALAWLGLPPELGGPEPGSGPDALVTVAANAWLYRHEPSLARWAAKRAATFALRLATRAAGRFPARALSLGSDDISKGFVEDLAAIVREGRWAGRDGVDYLAGLARIATPVLALQGGGDRLLSHEGSWRRFHARLPDAELRVYGARELGFEPGHMGLLTDARSRPAWRDVARWLAGRLGRFALRSVAHPARPVPPR